MKKVGFVFFDALHIIHHFVGVAVELNKKLNVDVHILTYEQDTKYLFFLIKLLGGSEKIVKKLPTYRYRKVIDKIKKRKQPSSLYLFKKHKKLLLSYDILVFNDINHEYLYSKRQNGLPKFVMLMHGAGDREYLIGDKYSDLVGKFDLVTTSGDKVNSFFEEMDLPDTNLAMCGYQKLDVVKIENKGKQFFTNNKPVIFYNPHFDKELSSFYKYGKDILDFFYNNDDYNFIFAPHINLFNKKGFLNKESIHKKYFEKENIHIDLGSINLVNMSYTMIADLYLGDVSSQVYEFLLKPRPCIFINTHKDNWKSDRHYQNWKLGKVISNLEKLPLLFKTYKEWQNEYIVEQKKAIAYTFEQDEKESATKKTVNSIFELL